MINVTTFGFPFTIGEVGRINATGGDEAIDGVEPVLVGLHVDGRPTC